MRGIRAAPVWGAACALVLLLPACTSAEQVAQTLEASPAPKAAQPANLEDSQPGSVGTPHDAHVPLKVGGLAEAMDLGVNAVTAFCRPALDYGTWIGELYPFLSQAAGAAYATVDPVNVPCTTVTGEPVVRDGEDPYTVGIAVPTDAGEYAVYLHRAAVETPWAVEQITPVSGE